MNCPKCATCHAEATMNWTISGRKLTIPSVYLWACVNPDCRYQWSRELSSPIHDVAYTPPSLERTPSGTSPPEAR